jgi:hypothetical protein
MKLVARVFIFIFLLASVGFAEENIQHRENLKVGPYKLEVGFSQWSVRAERSLDITFSPQDGIVGKSGTIKYTSPSGEKSPEIELVRFPKNRNIWGLDLTTLPKKGTWNLEFKIIGAQGTGVGNFKLNVLERPAGPSVALTQPLGLIPILAVIILATRAWLRVKPLRHAEANQW